MQEKTALVLSAGGMFGAYQAGAWRELSTRFQPDIVVGTSVGALNGWAIAGRCPPGELVRRWSDKSSGDFLRLRHPLYPWRCFFDNASFSSRVQEFFSAFTPRIPIGVTLADALRLRPRLVRSEEITWKHLAATCAIPLGLPPVRIDGTYYTDGGVLDVLPLWAAAEMGATRAIAINAMPEPPSRILRAAVSTVAWISPKSPKTGSLEVVSIAPPAALGTLSQLARWNRDSIQLWIERGAEDARRVMAAELAGRDFLPHVLQ
jgi:NTE family protein